MDAASLTLERAGQHAKVMDISEAGPSAVGIELSARSPAAPAPRPAAPAPRPAARPSRPSHPQQRVDEEELLDTMAEFANPVKKSAKPRRGLQRLQRRRQQYEESDDDDDDEEEDDEGSDEDDEGSDDMSDDEEGSADDEEGSEEYEDEEDDGVDRGGALRPSEGYRSIDEEKSDIMFKLQRLQRQGVKGLRQFTPYSDIRDMRAELGRIRNELELERSIKFQRKMLMALVSALEWGNSKFDPFSLELDGWSEQMHESVTTNSEYDGVFEELWAKYRGKMSTPPEIRLLMMVAGSAMMFHMTKAMVKSALPSMTPAMMHGMMSSANPSAAAAMAFEQPHPSQRQPQTQRPEMRGPGVDVGALMGGGGSGGGGGGLGGLGALGGLMGGGGGGLAGLLSGGVGLPPPMAPSARLTMPQSTRQAPPPPPRRVESDSDDSAAGTDDDAASDRLSDVVSDDLGSLPDDLSDNGKRGRSTSSGGGGGKRRKTENKKVITI